MGLILDSSILIASERRGDNVRELLARVRASVGESDAALSAACVLELTHGIVRARSLAHRSRRQAFCDELCDSLLVYPVTLEIAQLAGRIEGEQAAFGNIIALADLLIGATALHLGYSVATLNVRHFERIPGLAIITL